LRRRWWLAAFVLLFSVVAGWAVGRRAGGESEIRADQLNAGGSKNRASSSFWTQDVIGCPQPVGICRSSTYVSQGGLSYLTADPKPGDLDENGVVDGRDLFVFSLCWKRQAGEAGYCFSADLIQSLSDRRITEEDLLEWLRQFHAGEGE